MASGLSAAERLELREVIRAVAGRAAILLMEHDVGFVLALDSRVVVLDQGRVIFDGPGAAAVRRRRGRGRLLVGCPSGGPGVIVGPALTASDLTASRGGAPVLDGVSLTVTPGEAVFLAGNNGAGRSTLVSGPTVLLLDGPFLGLAPAVANGLVASLAGLRDGGRSLIVVDGHAGRVAALADRVVTLERGRVVSPA